MTMQSTNLLPALCELPTGKSRQRMSLRDTITGLVNTDRAMYAAEFASSISIGLWGIFSGFNVDDRLFEAYVTRWPNLSADHSLHEQVQSMIENGAFTENNWLVRGLKGQQAEFEARDWLEQNGYSGVEFPQKVDGEIDPSNEGWDIKAISPDGQEVLIQVKTGTSLSEGDFRNLMVENSDIDIWAVGTEYYDKAVRAAESVPDIVDRTVTAIGPDYKLVEGTTDGLETLSANRGIDIPDGVIDIIPYAAAIMAGARLICSVVKTEKEFKAADRTEKNKLQVVQTLTLMSRMGISAVLSVAGGKGGVVVGTTVGAMAGTVVPGVGNAVAGTVGGISGGIGGALSGWQMGRYLNKHLQPHMLNLALNITGITHDDLFYYKNKPRINEVSATFPDKGGRVGSRARLLDVVASISPEVNLNEVDPALEAQTVYHEGYLRIIMRNLAPMRHYCLHWEDIWTYGQG